FNPQFFVEQVRERLKSQSALIILSSPMAFSQGDDRRPIQVEGTTLAKVFYFRFHPPTMVRRDLTGGFRPARPRALNEPAGLLVQDPPDSLEPLLKPIRPRVFEVYNPEQFRKALAELMKELAQ